MTRTLIIILASLILVVGGVAGAKDPKYFKLLENCADKLSRPAILEELNIYYRGLKDLAGIDLPDYKKYYNDRIKLFSNLIKLPFSQKRTYLVYQPALFECEQSWEKNPIAFKSRWE